MLCVQHCAKSTRVTFFTHYSRFMIQILLLYGYPQKWNDSNRVEIYLSHESSKYRFCSIESTGDLGWFLTVAAVATTSSRRKRKEGMRDAPPPFLCPDLEVTHLVLINISLEIIQSCPHLVAGKTRKYSLISAVMYSAIILLWERGRKGFSTGTGILFTDVQASLKS